MENKYPNLINYILTKCEKYKPIAFDNNYWECYSWFVSVNGLVISLIYDKERINKQWMIEIKNIQNGSDGKNLLLFLNNRNWQSTAKQFILKESIKNYCNSARKTKIELENLIKNNYENYI